MKLDERMKRYEYVTRNYLINKMPVIIRLDGKAFHNFTKGMARPFDQIFADAMQATMQRLCAEIPNCKFGYTQSDEISLLLLDNNNAETQSWFDNNLSKLISISAAMATQYFNRYFESFVGEKYVGDGDFNTRPYEEKMGTALFDSRAFNVPLEEVNNYFIWRQQDCIRNSILMVGQANFSHKELQNLNCKKIVEKLEKEKGIIYESYYPSYLRKGSCVYKILNDYQKVTTNESGYRFVERREEKIWIIDENMPDLVKDKTFIQEKISNNKEI